VKPLVSVIITTYNRTTWLEEALQSCLTQSYPNLEIIIIDDGSKDSSAHQLSESFPKVQYYWQPNQGLGGARNTGIYLSKGEFIQFLDDDDLLEPSSIAEKMVVFSKKQNCGAVYSDLYLAQESGKIIGCYYDGQKRPLPQGNIFSSLLRKNFIPVHALLWRKSVLQQAGNFPIRSGAEDWECLVRASEFAEFSFLDQPLGYYRLHGKNMTFDYLQQLRGDAKVQQVIFASQQFPQIPTNKKIDLYFHYCLRQWAFGDDKLAISYFKSSRLLNSWDIRVLLLQCFMKLGRPFSRFMLRSFWMLRGLVPGYTASSYFLSRVR